MSQCRLGSIIYRFCAISLCWLCDVHWSAPLATLESGWFEPSAIGKWRTRGRGDTRASYNVKLELHMQVETDSPCVITSNSSPTSVVSFAPLARSCGCSASSVMRIGRPRNLTQSRLVLQKKKKNPIAKAPWILERHTTQLYESNTKETSHSSSCHHMYNSARELYPQPCRRWRPVYSLGLVSGSWRMPSASNRRRASSRAHVWMLCIVSVVQKDSTISSALSHRLLPCARQSCRWKLRLEKGFHVPGIGLESICHSRHRKAAVETPVPDAFPTLLLILLPGFDAKQPPGRGIVARTVASLRGLGLRELSAEGERKLEVRLAGRDGGRGTHNGAEGGG